MAERPPPPGEVAGEVAGEVVGEVAEVLGVEEGELEETVEQPWSPGTGQAFYSLQVTTHHRLK